MAPAPGAEAHGAGQAHGLPRDHPGRHPGGRGPPPRAGRGPRPGPGDPPDPRPSLRLRGQPRAVEEGHAAPVRRPRAVRRHPSHRRPGARAHGLPCRLLLGPRGDPRRRGRGLPARVHRPTGRSGRPPHRPGRELRLPRQGQGRRRRPRRGRGGRARRGPGEGPVLRRRRRGQALHPPSGGALPHHDPAAGGGPQTRFHHRPHDAHRPGALRGRLDHLHAHRLGHAV